MEENIQTPEPQDDDLDLRRAFQYAANRDRYDQLAALGRQLQHDRNIRRATVRRWLPWAAAAGVALFCLGFWLAPQVSCNENIKPGQTGQQQIPVVARMDSFIFSATSGEKFVVRMSSGDPSVTQPKLEVFSPQGELMGDFYQNDTLHFLKIELQSKGSPTPTPASRQSRPAKGGSPKPHPPVVSTGSDTILVADPNNEKRFLNNMLPARRIRVAGEQKTVEPLVAIPVEAFNEPVMRCVFYGDRIRLFVPAQMVEKQSVEILQLLGTDKEDSYYLRIGTLFFPLTSNGYTFDLKPVPKPKAFD